MRSQGVGSGVEVDLAGPRPLQAVLGVADGQLRSIRHFPAGGSEELLARLERQFTVTLPERAFAEAKTPRDLLRAIDSARGSRASARAPAARTITVGEARPVPGSASTLVGALRWHVESHPDRPHIKVLGASADDLTSLTYQQLWNAEAVQRINPAYPADVFLSFLPLAHSFARMADYYLPMMAGACIAYARSIEQLRVDLVEQRPTVLLSLPRIYECIYLAVETKLTHTRLVAALFHATIKLDQRRFEAAQGRAHAPPWWQGIAWGVLRRLVADKVLARLGGRIRLAVTGGAQMNENITRWFLGLGLPLVEGYGLTEASPVVSGNRPEDNLPGSVGMLLPGLEARLGPNE
jgi:hypothetical protein